MTEIVQESEMAAIRQIFERAANAIVQASELAVAVNELRTQVAKLVSDIEYSQAKNRELDEMLSNVRRQRDTALDEANAAKDKVHSQEMAINSLTQTNEGQASMIQTLRSDLDKVKTESEGWAQAALKADAELAEANAKLDKVQALFGGTLAPPTPAIAPEPVPREAPTYNAPSEPLPVPSAGDNVTMAEALPEPVKPSQDDPGFRWDMPYHYDPIRGRHVQD